MVSPIYRMRKKFLEVGSSSFVCYLLCMFLYYIQTRFNDHGVDSNGNLTAFSGTNTITGQSSSVTATPSSSTTTVDSVSFTSGYASPEIDADTGDVIYIENRSPITRASDQTENVKLIIEF